MGAVTIALIGFFAFLILRVTAPQMTTLFTDLSLEDSAAIIKDLERQAIPFEMRNDGATIMVPKDRVTRLRMKLAEGGLPKGGGVGYEIFDKSDALGATSFVQNINHLRALEGELARTIRAHRPRAGGARASGAAGTAAVLARQGRAVGLDRAEGARHAGTAAGARHPPSRRVGRQRAEAAAGLDRRRNRPAAGRRRAQRQTPWRRERRRAQDRLRAAPARAGRIDRDVGGRARAAPASSSPPISTSTASPRPRTSSIRKAAWCDRARRARNLSRAPTAKDGQVSVGNELPGGQQPPAEAQRPGTARPEAQDRGNRQLRDFPHHQDRGDRGRPGQPHLGRGPGRRQLHARTTRAKSSYQPREQGRDRSHRRAGAHRDRLRPKRGDQVEVVNLRFAETPAQPPISEPAGWM